MQRVMGLVLLAQVLTAGCLAAPADTPEPAWTGDLTVEPGGFAEVNLHLNTSTVLRYAWSTGGSVVAFDVHDHRGGEVTVHEEDQASEAEGRFHAPEPDTYSLLWQAREGQEDAVGVQVTLWGEDLVVESVHGASNR